MHTGQEPQAGQRRPLASRRQRDRGQRSGRGSQGSPPRSPLPASNPTPQHSPGPRNGPRVPATSGSGGAGGEGLGHSRFLRGSAASAGPRGAPCRAPARRAARARRTPWRLLSPRLQPLPASPPRERGGGDPPPVFSKNCGFPARRIRGVKGEPKKWLSLSLAPVLVKGPGAAFQESKDMSLLGLGVERSCVSHGFTPILLRSTKALRFKEIQ